MDRKQVGFLIATPRSYGANTDAIQIQPQPVMIRRERAYRVGSTREGEGSAETCSLVSLAADKGHRVAAAELGDLYEEANGVDQNLTRAFQHHLASAEQHWWRAGVRYPA